jgi:hypothetical protein
MRYATGGKLKEVRKGIPEAKDSQGFSSCLKSRNPKLCAQETQSYVLSVIRAPLPNDLTY